MNNDFQKIIDQLHDSRIFGFIYDSNIKEFRCDFYIYIQLFGNFENEKYELRKSLLCFSNAEVINLSIIGNLDQGQFFICEIDVTKDERYLFDFVFSSSDIKLSLYADNLKLLISDHSVFSGDQYLQTDWENLLR